MTSEKRPEPRIIEFNPQPTAGPEQGSPPDDTNVRDAAAVESVVGWDAHLDIPHFVELLEFLTALHATADGAYNRANVDIRTENIGDALPEQLYTWANRSNSNDWIQHPSFYDALIGELKARGLLPATQ